MAARALEGPEPAARFKGVPDGERRGSWFGSRSCRSGSKYEVLQFVSTPVEGRDPADRGRPRGAHQRGALPDRGRATLRHGKQ